MSVLACATHWYISGMFVVPVLAVGGWSWWSTRRGGASSSSNDPQGPASPA